MHKAFKYRFYPTPEQESLLRRTVGCCRFVYNRALAIRSEAWSLNKERLSGFDLMKKITVWKREPETMWLAEVSNVSLQQSVNNLEVAFQNFFAKRAKYPKYKKKGSGGSCRFTTGGFRIKNGDVWLAKTHEPLNIVWSRPLDGTPSQCTVRLTPSGQWFVTFLCQVEIAKLPPVNKHVGLDMGLNALVTTSDGEQIANPRCRRKHQKNLALAQRRLARKVKGSKNRRKAAIKVARVYRRISDAKKDQLHKFTTRLVRENQSIAIEDLAVRNMLKNHRLAGSISDASWTMIRSMLEYKCNWYGRELRIVDRWFPSSKTCSKCGHVVERLPLKTRSWTCTECATVHDRDINAAHNILAAGLAVIACGEAGRPKWQKPPRLASSKQENQ